FAPSKRKGRLVEIYQAGPAAKISEVLSLVLISQATHRHQVLRARWLLLNLGAQALDVYVESLGISDIVSSPNAVNELTASEYPSSVAQQVFKQVEFF